MTAPGRSRKGSRLLHLLRTTDPKDIGIMYLTTSFLFFLVGEVYIVALPFFGIITEIIRCSAASRRSVTG